MTYSLDVNVLIALFGPDHVHHEAAHSWFATVGHSSWATCPITENGFVRVVTNPAYPKSVSTIDAIGRLHTFCSESRHVFWKDSLSLRSLEEQVISRIAGHQQITDVYLVALARHYHGKLVTIDKRVSLAIDKELRGSIEQIAI